jgi:glycosyltransferase involved in cell wall biosynthesis
MRIALVGTRGIPAAYGGFETFAEELSTRLAARGHHVTVYCRTNNISYPHDEYRGVRLVKLPTIPHKYFDTIAHTFLATLHLLLHGADVCLYCNGANTLFTALPRLAGIPVAINVDGLERHRKKWNRLAKAWYALSERLTTLCPTAVVTDAQTIADYYLERYGQPSCFIPYGARTEPVTTRGALDRFGLDPGQYWLYVSRLEPENNALLVVKAFERTAVPQKLVVVGDAPYAPDYVRQVRATRDPRIVFTGYVFGQGYHELQTHSFAYIHATEVGGTHPALVEAMGRGRPVLYLNNPENHEVAGGVGIPFDNDEASLASAIERLASMPDARRQEQGDLALARVRERYDWDRITDRYESLLAGLPSWRRARGAASLKVG